jgi:NAD(P)-dependent dehydrogenase (short-subunit alcohol dehydrogenase family)
LILRRFARIQGGGENKLVVKEGRMSADVGRKRIFITGGRRGIGRGIAYAFAETGADIVINDIVDDGAVGETLDGIRARGGRGAFVKGDAAAVAEHAQLLDAAAAAFGGAPPRIDVLVNNAGVSVEARGDLLDLSPSSFDRLMAVNLRGPFFLTQALARRWIAEPARPRTIVTISSINAEMASLNRGEYCIAKSGLAMMTKLFALRLAEADIGALEIRPGIIATDMTAPVKARYDALIGEGLTPVRRWGEPADIGRAAVALASGAFGFSVGEAIRVDGGLAVQRF